MGANAVSSHAHGYRAFSEEEFLIVKGYERRS
jgi:hypothetical protein